ncbi:hypothetical protein KGY73_07345 [bacterium]|nr:hypothetical protein [bacterium]
MILEKRKFYLLPFVFIVLFLAFSIPIFPKANDIDVEELKKEAPKVFLDCRRCDKKYIRTEITFVNYVRDSKEADIHVLMTSQRTGGGGREYTISFIGQKRFFGMEHTLNYISHKTDTRDERRKGMVEILKKGLFPFIMKTPILKHISLKFKPKLMPTAVADKWNFWVFNIGLHGRINGEKKRQSSSINGHVSANRVTPELKFRLNLSGNFDESQFDVDGETITSSSEKKNVTTMLVKSLGDHWSLGGWFRFSTSTYRNIKSEVKISPAVEFNLFPYEKATRRQLRFLYRTGYVGSRYIEKTIYNKFSDDLIGESLSITFEVKEPWGNASTSIEGSHYFRDISKNRLKLRGNVNVRLVKGLSLSFHGRYSRIHDQLSLSKGEASLDEILLRRKQLATDFNYNLSLGLSYTFGSVYSNVVNPRFGW